jgi:hypothetical protein
MPVPNVGAIVDGYRFKGGNPNDQKNWELAPVAVPKPGAVSDGYVFKGGNPNDQKNWKPVQATPVPEKQKQKFAPSVIEEVPVIGGALSGIADIPLGIATGVATIGKTFTDLFGADNAASDAVEAFGKGADELRSAEAREDSAKDAAEMAAANGFWEGAGAAGKAFLRHPLDVTANLLGTAAPAAIAAAGALIAAPASAATAAIAAAGVGLASGVGMIKGDIYDATLARAKQAGLSDAQAEKIAEEAQAYGGENTDMIALGGVIGGAASATGAGPLLGKMIAGKVLKDVTSKITARTAAAAAAARATGTEVAETAAETTGKGLIRRGVEGALVEGVPEGIQAGQEALAENLAQTRAGFPTDTWKGVLSRAGYEGTLGGILGGGISAVSGRGEVTDKRQEQIDDEERRAIEIEAVSGGVGKAYEEAVARYKSEGVSDREANLKAGEDIRAYMADRRNINEPITEDTTDAGGTKSSVPSGDGIRPADVAGSVGETDTGPVGVGGDAAGTDIGVEGQQQRTLDEAKGILANKKIKLTERVDVARELLNDTILNNPLVNVNDIDKKQFDAAKQQLANGKHNGDPVAALEAVTGKSFAAPLDINETVAAPAGPTLDEAAKAPVAEAIKAATQPNPANVVPGIAETAAKDLGITPEPAPVVAPAAAIPLTEESVVAQPTPTVADVTPEDVALTPAPEMAAEEVVAEEPAPVPYRPDRREPAVVWDNFEKAFAGQRFPDVSWALGSDWGMGTSTPDPASYRRVAEERMTRLYGPKPEVQAAPEMAAAPEVAPVQEVVQPAPVQKPVQPAPVQKPVQPAPVEVTPEEDLEEAPEDKAERVMGEIEEAFEGVPEMGIEPFISEKTYNRVKFELQTKRRTIDEVDAELKAARERHEKKQRYQASRSGKAAVGMAVEDLVDHIADLTKNWRAKIGVKVIGTIDELPVNLREAVERDGMESVPAFVAPDGTIYFIANNIDTFEEASSAVYHEALGHLGLRSLFDTRLDAVLAKLYRSSKKLREQADQWTYDNPGVYANDKNPSLRALEEVLAEQSEAGRVDASVWAKISAVIKDFGRRIGLKLDYSDAEVRSILAMAHDQIIDGKRESTVVKGLRYVAGFGRTDQVESETSEQPRFMAGKAKKKAETATVQRLKRKLRTSHYAADMSAAAGDMFFQTRSGKEQIDLLDSAWKAMKNKSRRFVIGYLYYSRDLIRAINKLSPPVARKLSYVNELLHRMDGFRNMGLKTLTYNTLRYSKFNAKFKEGGILLSDLINGSTLASVDPRHASLAAAMAADIKLTELVKEGASKNRIDNRKALIKEIYDMYEKLGTPEMGKGEGQSIYKMVMGGFERSFDNEYKAIVSNVRQSGLPADRIQQAVKQITEMYATAKRNAPYAPLFRTGQFWLRVGKGKNRRVFRFESETLYQQGMKDAVKWLQESGDTRSAAEIKADDKVFNFGRDIDGLEADFMRSEPSDVLKNVFQEIDKGGMADGSAIKDMIFQLYAASLPKGTLYEKMQHREGVEGFSADTLRAYIDAQMATINRLTHLKYASKIRQTVGEAYGLMAGNPNREQLQPYIDEMAIRVAETFSPDISKLDPLARLANKATFFYLLTSIKSALVQFLQLPTVALPALGARYGTVQAAAVAARYIATIGNKFGTAKVDEDGNIVTNWGQPTMGDSKYVNENKDPKMREALKFAWADARERGILDTTFAGDMVSRKSGPSAQYQGRPAKISKWVFDFMSGGIHHSERIAREIAYMSAFELDYNQRIKGGMDHQTAMSVAADTAADLTLETMFDFSESSKPRAMKGPIGRVALQFYSFPIQIASMLTRTFLGTVTLLPNAERKVAAKQFFGIIGMTWLFAGTTGMPGYSFMMGLMTSLLAAAGLADDDDDDKGNNALTSRNLDLWFREKFLPEYFGPDSDLANDLGLDEGQAQDLTRAVKMGPISAATNLNLGSSVGLDGLFFRDDTPVDTNEEAMRSLWYTLSLGATGSVLRNFVRGGDYMMKGEWQRAAENLTPAPVRNALIAKRLGSEGYITPSTQDVVAPVEEYTWGKLVGQGIGFGRTDISDIQKSNLLAKKTVDKIEKERADYINKLDKAYRDITLKRTDMKGGQEAINKVWKDIFKWNDNTDYINPIFLGNWEDSIETRGEDRSRSMQGLRVSKNYDPYVRGLLEKNR